MPWPEGAMGATLAMELRLKGVSAAGGGAVLVAAFGGGPGGGPGRVVGIGGALWALGI